MTASTELQAQPVTPTPYARGILRRSAYECMRADEIRAELFTMLGPVCGQCGRDLHGVAWEVNHLRPREWQPRKLSRYRRNKRYLQEAMEGLVELCCPECNKEYRPRAAEPENPANPF